MYAYRFLSRPNGGGDVARRVAEIRPTNRMISATHRKKPRIARAHSRRPCEPAVASEDIIATAMIVGRWNGEFSESATPGRQESTDAGRAESARVCQLSP